MPKRLPPTFHQGPLDHAAVAALNQLARDFYQSLYGAFGAAPPLQVSQDLGGVIYSVEPVALQQLLNNQGMATGGGSITVNDLATPGGAIEVAVTGVTTLQFTDPNDDDPFAISSPATGFATVEFFPASQTQAGYITVGGVQSFRGEKDFTDAFGSIISLVGAQITITGTSQTAWTIGSAGGNTFSTWWASTSSNALQLYAAGSTSFPTGALNLLSSTGAPLYAVQGVKGVTGTIQAGATATGGLVTALGGAAPAPGPGGSITPGRLALQWMRAAQFNSSAFANGVQQEFFNLPAGYQADQFMVEVLTPFASSLPPNPTLDLGTAGNPTGYLSTVDLTQARGSFNMGQPSSESGTVGSLTSNTSLKVRVNFGGVLTAGDVRIHARVAQVTDQGSTLAPFAQYDWPNPLRPRQPVQPDSPPSLLVGPPQPFSQTDWPNPRVPLWFVVETSRPNPRLPI